MGWFGTTRRSRWGLLALGVLLVAVAAGCAGTPLWVSRYNGPANGSDQGPTVAVSRSGDRVFVSGTSFGSVGSGSISTVAYDAANGQKSWADVYPEAYAHALAVSPDGSRVFVTGHTAGAATDFVTIAYSAANGQRLWVSHYNGAGNSTDVPQSLAVSPDSTKLFVTGYSDDSASQNAYATVAYDTTNGAQLWVRTFTGTAGSPSQAVSVGVSPDGTRVFVTGSTAVAAGTWDYGTVAYAAANGAQLWFAHYRVGSGSFNFASRLVVSPDGSKVFVTGSSAPFPFTFNGDFATVAYNAATGAQLWVSRYSGPADGGADTAKDVAVSPDGTKVFVTGSSEYDISQYPAPTSAATVAYNASNGAQLWANRYNGAGSATAQSIGVKPDGTKIYVTGASSGGASHSDYATLAYNVSNGAPGWTAVYDAKSYDSATSLAVSPDTTNLFVTGTSDGGASSTDFATIAYSLS